MDFAYNCESFLKDQHLTTCQLPQDTPPPPPPEKIANKGSSRRGPRQGISPQYQNRNLDLMPILKSKSVGRDGQWSSPPRVEQKDEEDEE